MKTKYLIDENDLEAWLRIADIFEYCGFTSGNYYHGKFGIKAYYI